MRNPNCKCCICGKALYRRPFELKKIRYVSCREHQLQAKRKFGVTEKQRESLKLGRQPGSNGLEGIPKSEDSKSKRSKSMKLWIRNNPKDAASRALMNRGENHYNWKGGVSDLNKSIRQMTENRNWMERVKQRDKVCVNCGSETNLEAHHKVSLSEMIERYNITNREDARNNAHVLWDVENGETLCKCCHYNKHERRYYAD